MVWSWKVWLRQRAPQLDPVADGTATGSIGSSSRAPKSPSAAYVSMCWVIGSYLQVSLFSAPEVTRLDAWLESGSEQERFKTHRSLYRTSTDAIDANNAMRQFRDGLGMIGQCRRPAAESMSYRWPSCDRRRWLVETVL